MRFPAGAFSLARHDERNFFAARPRPSMHAAGIGGPRTARGNSEFLLIKDERWLRRSLPAFPRMLVCLRGTNEKFLEFTGTFVPPRPIRRDRRVRGVVPRAEMDCTTLEDEIAPAGKRAFVRLQFVNGKSCGSLAEDSIFAGRALRGQGEV